MNGRYRLLHCLARGGMAEIWLAQDASTPEPRLVVVKQILPGLAQRVELVEMFLDEAKLAAHLHHPNVVEIYEQGVGGGDPFIAMELIHGENLRTVVRRAAAGGGTGMPMAMAVAAVAQACRGLHHAHTAKDEHGRALGIIHRDISPQNLLLSYEGRVKVVDFGIAKAAISLTETRTGVLKGKYPYMSPEQVLGRKLSARSDLFSLGLVLWELLSGERLYRQSTDFLVMQAIVKEPPPPPSSFRRDVPRALDALVVRSLAKDPRDRWASARELGDALEAFLDRQGAKVSEADLADYMRELFPDRQAVWARIFAEAKAGGAPGEALLDELAAGGGATPALGSAALGSGIGSVRGGTGDRRIEGTPEARTPAIQDDEDEADEEETRALRPGAVRPAPDAPAATVAARPPDLPRAARPPPAPPPASPSSPPPDSPAKQLGFLREAPPADAPEPPPAKKPVPAARDARLDVEAEQAPRRQEPPAPPPEPSVVVADHAFLAEAPDLEPEPPPKKPKKAKKPKKPKRPGPRFRLPRRARKPAPEASRPAPAQAPRPRDERPSSPPPDLRKLAGPLLWTGRIAVAAITIGGMVWLGQAIFVGHHLARDAGKLVDPVVENLADTAGEPIPGRIDAKSEPSGAAVRVDGRLVGHTPLSRRYSPKHATVVVEIDKTGFRRWRRRVHHAKGGIRVDAQLVRR